MSKLDPYGVFVPIGKLNLSLNNGVEIIHERWCKRKNSGRG